MNPPAKLYEDLTPLEFDALRLAACGFKDLKVVAEILHTSAGAVAQLRREYREKLGATTPERAIALAFCYGVLTPKDVL